MRAPLFTALLALLLLAPAARADVLLLKDGRRFEGTVTSQTETEVVFTTEFGKMTFKASEVSRIEKGKTPRQEFDERYKAATTAKELVELGKWAESNKLATQARRAMRKARKLDPGNDEANKWLGYVKYKGQWVTEDELELVKIRENEAEMKKRGLVRHGDRWVTLAEKAKLDAGQVYHEGRWMSPEEQKLAQGYVLVGTEWVLFHVAKAREHCAEVLKKAGAKGEVALGPDHAVAGPFEKDFLEPISRGLVVGRAYFDGLFDAPLGVDLLGGRAAELFVWGREGDHYTQTVDYLASLTDTVPEGWADAVKRTHGFVYWDPFCCSSARVKGRPLEDLAGHSYHHWGHLLLNRHRYDGRLLPPWFDEGFASLLEFRTHRRNAVFCLGKPAAIVTETGGRTSARRKTVEYVFDSKLFRHGTWRETLAKALRDENAEVPTFDELAKRQFGELTLLDIAMGMGICLWLEGQDGALERFHASLRASAPEVPLRVFFVMPERHARYDAAFHAAVDMGWRQADRAWRTWFLTALEEEGGAEENSKKRRRGGR